MEKYLNKEFLLSNKDKIIKAAAAVILVAVAFFVFVLGEGTGEQEQMIIDTQQESAADESSVPSSAGPEVIIVDVAGAVNYPQVVELPAESRVADAISAAGGLTDNADTSKINQAAFINDGEKLYVPEIGEEYGEEFGSGITSIEKQSGKIDLNTATSEELQTLNGVGPATAEKIIRYRSDVGYFGSIDELKNVDGIGDKTYEQLKDYITV